MKLNKIRKKRMKGGIGVKLNIEKNKINKNFKILM